jgi:hypothetical protein
MFLKNLLKNKEMVFENEVKNIQANSEKINKCAARLFGTIEYAVISDSFCLVFLL